MPYKSSSQKGFIQILMLAILLVGVVAGVYLVSQRTNLFPKAATSKKVAELKLASGSNVSDFPYCTNDLSAEDIYETIPEPTRNFGVTCTVNKTEARVGEEVTWTAVINSNLESFVPTWQGSYPINVGNNSGLTQNQKTITKTVVYKSNGYKYAKVSIKSGASKSGKAVCSGIVKVTGQPQPAPDGLRAHYYNGGCLGNPKLSGGTARRVGGISTTGDSTKAPYPVDSEINFNWGQTPPKEGILPCFSANWAGYIVPPESGEYIFSATVNDGARLWVDYKLIFNAWEKRGQEQEVVGTPIRLEANKRYDLLLNYFNSEKDAQIKLFWKKPNTDKKEIIPQQYLYSNSLSYCKMP